MNFGSGWVNILSPNPNGGRNLIVWTSDKYKLVDHWVSKFHKYWNNYVN